MHKKSPKGADNFYNFLLDTVPADDPCLESCRHLSAMNPRERAASELLNQEYGLELLFRQNEELIFENDGSQNLAKCTQRRLPNLDFIARVMDEKKFPKTRMAQIRFLAESCATDGQTSPRRSRDLCGEARRLLSQAK